VIRRKITEFYTVRKEIPTIRNLTAALKEDGVVECSSTYLAKYLKGLGYRWRTLQSRRVALMESWDIVFKRHKFLKDVKQHRDEGRHIIYVDETYVNSSLTTNKCWQSPTELGHLREIGAGRRLIVVHAGGNEGFIAGSLLIFKSKCKSGDYHDDMNFGNFKKWTEEMLVPNLPPRSTIILDNASYHNVEIDRKPPKSALKKAMIEWLSSHNVECNSMMLKSELYSLIQSVNVEKKLVIDEILKNHGHKVLRLPPYHADLNPIELVWGDIKGTLAREHLSSNLEEKCERMKLIFKSFGKEKWEKCVDHVLKIEEEYASRDRIFDLNYDTMVEDLRFTVSDDSTDDSSSTDSDIDIE
jgi:transposase